MWWENILTSWSIRRKLLLLIVAVFLPGAGVIVHEGLENRKRDLEEARREVTLLVESLAAQQEKIAVGTKQMLSTLAQLPQVQSLDAKACSKLFAELLDENPMYSAVGASTPDGNIFAHARPFEPGSVNISEQKHVRDTMGSLDFSVGEYMVGRLTNVPAIYYGYPVVDDAGRLLAIVTAGFKLTEYDSFIKKANLPVDSAVVILDHRGVRLYRFPVNEASPLGRSPKTGFDQIADLNEGTFERHSDDGTYHLFAFKRLRLNENSSPYLLIAAGIPKDKILQKANMAMLNSLLVLGVAALIAVSLAFTFGNIILMKPINHLVAATRRFGRGEMDARTGLLHTRDELGQLAQSFDDMADLLEQRNLERKKAEEALRKSEHFVRQVIESTPNLLYIYDLVEKRSIYTNREAKAFFGSDPEHIKGADRTRFERLFHPDDIPLMEEHHKALASAGDGEVRVLEYRARHISGEWRWLTSHDVVFARDAEGRVTQILGSAQNITDRKQMEEALGESMASYRALAENLPGIVYRSFPDRKTMLFFNDMLETITGHSSEELNSRGYSSIEPLILPEDREQITDAVRDAVDERKPFEVSYRLRHKNSSTRNCLEQGRPIYDEHGEFLHIEGVIFDTTERIRLEHHLRQAQKMEAIGTLAGGIAHDFNNILATILTYSQIALREVPDSSPAHDDLEQVVQSSLRAKDLVKQILAFSRQTDKEKKHPLRIGSIIKEAIQLLRASLPTTIEIRQSIMSKEDTALIDPTQVHQVLMNLCTNAAHAMRDKGGVLDIRLTKVEFDARNVVACPDLKAGPYLRLAVSDTGHGMAPDTLQQIFDPYFTTKEPGEGTGLGLAVVHGIVKQHDGAIRVHSEPGQGSTFEVLFPVIAGNPESSLKDDVDIPGGTERILLVDDEEALLAGRKRLFEKLGYRVVTAKNGLEALEIFQSQPDQFDLVVSDCTMPYMTGFELTEQIRRIRPDISIVLSTGGGTPDLLEKAKEAGIRDIALKPLNLRDFALAVRRALDRDERDD